MELESSFLKCTVIIVMYKTHAIAKYIPFKFITTGRTKFNRYNSYLEGNKHLHSDAG